MPHISPSLVNPKWKVEMSVEAISLGEDTKVIEPVGLAEIQVGVNSAGNCCRMVRGLRGPAHIISNFAPNEYRGVFNPSSLAVYKGSNATEKGNSNCN